MGKRGFTLAELLIALAILGVIATFAIPKVLNSQQNGAWNAAAKEAGATLNQSYSAFRLEQTPASGTTGLDLTPYLNYVREIPSGNRIDHVQTLDDIWCDTAAWACYELHNGGVIAVQKTVSFGGTDNTNVIYWVFDPDGQYSGSTTGQGKSLSFFQYYDGRLMTEGYLLPGTASSANTYPSDSAKIPPWFSWD